MFLIDTSLCFCKRYLHVTYEDHKASFEELITAMDNSVSVYYKNLNYLAIKLHIKVIQWHLSRYNGRCIKHIFQR